MLRPYIEFKNRKGKEAKAKGDNYCDVFFKLLNNAFHGKTIEDHYNVEIVNDIDRYNKLVENIRFKYDVEFDLDLSDLSEKKS